MKNIRVKKVQENLFQLYWENGKNPVTVNGLPVGSFSGRKTARYWAIRNWDIFDK